MFLHSRLLAGFFRLLAENSDTKQKFIQRSKLWYYYFGERKLWRMARRNSISCDAFNFVCAPTFRHFVWNFSEFCASAWIFFCAPNEFNMCLHAIAYSKPKWNYVCENRLEFSEWLLLDNRIGTARQMSVELACIWALNYIQDKRDVMFSKAARVIVAASHITPTQIE